MLRKRWHRQKTLEDKVNEYTNQKIEGLIVSVNRLSLSTISKNSLATSRSRLS
jgi:hypothetical protein